MTEPVFLIANGDLRLSANQKCWPAQETRRSSRHGGHPRAGREVERGASVRSRQAARLHRQPEARHARCSATSRATRRWWWCEAVWQYSHHVLHGLYHASRPDSDGGQLERPVAGPGRHAESQRLADQGRRCATSTLWSEDFTDEFFLTGLQRWLQRRTGACTTRQPRAPARSASSLPAAGEAARRANWPSSCSATRPSWASSTKAAWACTTPSSPMNCCIPRASSRSGSASRRCTPRCATCRTPKRARCATGSTRRACNS